MTQQIAIIGAPGSGKTELANALAKQFDDLKECKSCEKVIIVDDYISEIEKSSDFVLGKHGTYLGNLYAVLGRYERERHAIQKKPDHIITCGTLIESSVYATLQAVGGQTDLHWVRITNFMNMLGCIYQDTWTYDHIFYLPLEEGELETPIRMAIEAFGVNATKLKGSLEEKLAQAAAALELAEHATQTN